MPLFGISWVGVTEQNGRKLLLSVIFVLALVVVRLALRAVARLMLRDQAPGVLQARFWVHQGLNLLFALLVALGLASIWFEDPARLATAFGLISAGLAFAAGSDAGAAVWAADRPSRRAHAA